MLLAELHRRYAEYDDLLKTIPQESSQHWIEPPWRKSRNSKGQYWYASFHS